MAQLKQPDASKPDMRAADDPIPGFKVVRTDLSSFKQGMFRRILEQLADVPDEQLRYSEAETPEQAADRFVSTRRVLNEWDEAVGPFYDTAGLTSWLQKKHRMNIKHMVDRREVLAVKAGRTLMYPTFQFSRDGQPLPDLPRVLSVLEQHLPNPWDQALWLNSRFTDDNGETVTAADQLRGGHGDDVVLLAEEDTYRWAS